MSYTSPEEAKFFKLMRGTAEPVTSDQYHKLYTAVADLVLRSNDTVNYYRNKSDSASLRRSYSPGLQPYPGDILEEQGVTGWIDGVRLVGVSIFHEASLAQGLFGIEAMAQAAPVVRRRPEDQFVLSRDGDTHWVTEESSFRSITHDDLDALAYDLSLVPASRAQA